MYKIARNLLFQFNPEFSHKLALNLLNLLKNLKSKKIIKKSLKKSIMGLNFNNPVGLAAGLDKDAVFIDSLAKLNFGFIEVGTVTPWAQSGNYGVRMQRIPEYNSIINRMGFNNLGVDSLVKKIIASNYKHQGNSIIGVNIGKNAMTPLRLASNDYSFCLRKVYNIADYIVLNISSPNTMNLRKLHGDEYLRQLLRSLKQEQLLLTKIYNKYVPLVIKLSPDLNDIELEQLSKIILKYNIDGVILANTSISRPKFLAKNQCIAGGLSGQLIFPLANRVLKILVTLLKPKVAIIASGGIITAEDAIEKFKLGADLVQIYSGLIYTGPQLVHNIIDQYNKYNKIIG